MKKKSYRKGQAGAGGLMNVVFAHTPVSILQLLGGLLYRHAG